AEELPDPDLPGEPLDLHGHQETVPGVGSALEGAGVLAELLELLGHEQGAVALATDHDGALLDALGLGLELLHDPVDRDVAGRYGPVALDLGGLELVHVADVEDLGHAALGDLPVQL